MDLLVVALAAVVPLASAVLVVVGLAEHRESVRLEAENPVTLAEALAINQQDWESEIRLLAGDCSPVDQLGLLPVPDEKEAP